MNFKKFYSKYYNLVYENKNYKSEVNYIIKILGSRIKKIKCLKSEKTPLNQTMNLSKLKSYL